MKWDGDPALVDLRRRTGRKWTRYPPDVLPAWIADMDFAPAPPIREALDEAIACGDLGYGPPGPDSGVPEAFARWAEKWDWRVDSTWVRLAPDVVGSLANCVEALTGPGDAVVVQTPIYAALMSVVRCAGRRLVMAPFATGAEGIEALAEAFADPAVGLFLLCNPHNPTGRCLTAEDLAAIAGLAERHGVTIVADEVHADLAYPGFRHVSLASLGEAAAARTVTLNSPSKAFNVAGLRTAVCVAADPGLNARLSALPASRWTGFSTLGLRAALAAWSDEGSAWLELCMARLAQNRDHLAARLARDLPDIRCTPPDAGYLAWLDLRALHLPAPAARHLLDHARVALSPGEEFGPSCEGFARLNFATSPEILEEMLDRMVGTLAG